MWFYQLMTQQLTFSSCSAAFADSANHAQIISDWSLADKTTHSSRGRVGVGSPFRLRGFVPGPHW